MVIDITTTGDVATSMVIRASPLTTLYDYLISLNIVEIMFICLIIGTCIIITYDKIKERKSK